MSCRTLNKVAKREIIGKKLNKEYKLYKKIQVEFLKIRF